MALNETSKEFISLKKLQGKAHTSNNKGLANEALSSGLTVSAKTVFSTDIPASPTATKYTITSDSVQYVRLSASFIAGSDSVAGRHAFALSLPDDFQTPAGTTNSLSKKGSGVFVNTQTLNTTGGGLQLVPPSYGTGYEAKPFSHVNGAGPETQIPVLDSRDWYIDYFNGILFQQDPPGTGDHAQNPRFVDAYIFVGNFVSDSLIGASGAPTGAQYVTLATDATLTNERVLTPGTGLDLTDAGAGGNLTLDVDISEYGDVQVAAGDKFLMLDQDGSTHQLESIDDISTFQAGAGLAAASGVLSVDIDELSELAEAPHATQDEFMVSDNGTEKRVSMTNVAAGAFSLVSGDATIAASGALTLEAGAVEDSMLNDDVAAGLAGVGLAASSGVLSVGVDGTGIEIDSDALRLKDSGVTLTKMANLANMRVIGNVSGSPAAPAAITILDEDNMSSNSSTSLASQQSIKAYVDSVAQGLDPKASVVAATVASFTMASTASSSTLVLADGEGGFSDSGNSFTVDGVSIAAAGRVLIKNGVNSNSAGVHNKWNGIYIVGVLSGSTLTLTRASDADQDDISGGAHVFVEQGTTNGDTGFVCTNDDAITIGTTAVTWSQFSGPGVFSAGDGLDLTGKVFSLDIKSAGGIKIDSTELAVEPANFAGAGLEDDGSDNLRVHVHGLNADSNAGNLGDSIAIADVSDSNLTKKITLTQLKTLIDADTTFAAGDGLDLAGTTFSLDLKASGGLAIDSTELSLDYAGADSFVKAATDGTGITVDASNDLLLVYDNDAAIVKHINPSQLPGGTIGAAEDGSYTDGLFTDFTSSTAIGTPIDRFNEVLKLLVPAPAPDLDDIDSNVTSGVAGDLSFGAANNQSSASPPYISVAASAGLGSALDVNGLYTTAENSNNLRRGLFNGTVDQTGDLNEDVAADITSPSSRTNYPVDSFGDADVGSLILEVNGADLYTLSLTAGSTGTGSPGAGSGTHVNGSGSGFTNLSAATAGTFDGGASFASFKHRTGRWKVAAADQRNGWNYARVKHSKGSVINTNYVEWVNDNDSNTLAASANTLAFSGTGSKQISGVTYFTGGTGRYQVTVSNAYKYVYDKTTNHTFTTSNAGLTSGASYAIAAITPADIGGSEDHTKQIVVDETDTVTANYILGGSLTAGISVAHPLKSNLANAGQASASGILLYSVSDTATALSETFQDEDHRLQVGTYANQSDAASGNAWDSSVSLVHGSDTAHNTGLQVYRERLYSPRNTLNSGDFRNSSDGGSLANGPAGNPNYSASSGTRTYYRKFQNTSGASVRDFTYTIAGDVTLVGASDSIGADDKFKLSFKMPNDGSGNSTGFLDAKNAFALGSTSDADGGAIGSVDTSDAMTNHVSFGIIEVGNNEFIVAKIEAAHTWTGYIDSLVVAFGAVGSVAASPNVNNIDQDTDGVAANLSFGDTLTKSGYSTIETTAGGTARNANDLYALSAPRHGVLNGATNVVGTINESTSASANAYPANAFGSGVANTGTLKLEVNGSVIHTTNLASFGSGDSLTSSSGFTSLSAATNGLDTSSLPDFTKWYRTGSWKVAVAAQRKGFNFARVIHTIGATDHESSYTEWVNDDDASTVTMSNVAVGDFSESGSSFSLSGVTYFVSPVGKFHFTTANLYKYVYSDASNAIRFPTSTNCTVTQIAAGGTGVTNATTSATQTTLPLLDTGVSDAHDQNLVVTGSFSVDSSTSIPGNLQTVTLVGRVNHPLKGNIDTSSTQSGNLLIFTATDSSTNLVEQFNGEAKRRKSGTYTQQSHVTASGNNWDSTVSLVHGSDTAHNQGLMVFNGKLVAFTAGNNTNINFASLVGPSGNPNYSAVSAGTREYIRWFRNTEGAARQMFQITINGTGTIIASTGTLGANANLMVHFKIPSSNASQSTGWMDIASTFNTGQYSDDAGCFDSGNGSFDSSLNATNWGTFGTHFASNNEYILIRVKAHSTWTGNITDMTLAWRTA